MVTAAQIYLSASHLSLNTYPQLQRSSLSETNTKQFIVLIFFLHTFCFIPNCNFHCIAFLQNLVSVALMNCYKQHIPILVSFPHLNLGILVVNIAIPYLLQTLVEFTNRQILCLVSEAFLLVESNRFSLYV